MEYKRIADGLYRGESGKYVAEIGRGKPGAWIGTLWEDGVLIGVWPPVRTWHIAAAMMKSSIIPPHLDELLEQVDTVFDICNAPDDHAPVNAH